MRADQGAFAGRVLESMGSGFVGVDEEGRVVWLNQGARELLAGSSGEASLREVVGRDCREVFREQPTIAALLLDTLHGRGGLSRAELGLEVSPGDAPTTIGLTLFPVQGEDGTPAGAAMLFRDLAPIEHSAEQEALQARLAALGQMAAGLAHELRNPLAAMELITGLLLRRLPDGEPLELAQDLQGQVRALTAIVNTSLDFLKPQVTQRARVDPVALLDAAIERVVPSFRAPPTIEKHFDSQLPTVAVDAEPLTLALANLIANACQALEDAGTREPRIVLEIACGECLGESAVRVDADATAHGAAGPARELVISVADNGPGVPPALREKIFYPFFTTREEGSGIGLATVQKVVASHGGTLALESRPGHGARFGVHLPLEPAAGSES
jgi:signal transduction histidine kinase